MILAKWPPPELMTIRAHFMAFSISRFGDLHWPEITRFHCSRLLVMKSRVSDSQALKKNIRQECENLSPEVLAILMENAIKRARMVINCGDGHLTDIIYSTGWNKF